LCEINNWWERRRFGRRDRDTVKPNVQKSAARVVSHSNDGVTQFLEHAWIDEHAPGTFHVVGNRESRYLHDRAPTGRHRSSHWQAHWRGDAYPNCHSFRRDPKVAVED